MASEEHQRLSQYVKDVHSALRRSTLKLGAEKAWQKHCENKEKLASYAKCMQTLATAHWEQNIADDLSKANSRIKWTVDLCNDYFVNLFYEYYREKDYDVAKKLNLTLDTIESFSETLKFIDVGSCYNPFKQYPFLDVFAIDLCPANDSVFQCDFLQVPVGDKTVVGNSQVTQLEQCSFDVVAFCFFLEYLPSSQLRINACEKAYDILKPGGLLVISTPDSKHVGANSKIMKCWRYSLALMGFSRIKYEKFKYMHCMAFRKSLHPNIAKRWAYLYKEANMEYEINIPQDFNKDDDYVDLNAPSGSGLNRVAFKPEDFQELPFCNEDF
ncbi:S-adenosylmethionine sensor upstream of mTORC1 [Manduca sexta]|uniref:S-adenosylmethionine sensor upstream of mTORC1 n=1 Tax=Manduca sexta TaxID=7130 RepID=A0A921ZEJ7_MANSE|nr:S-adenosylmethionine sensor upstream of mTORC1 [Manduca sexta]KAG6456070.1 hypothetical protein O3G_MSEX009559 [Manduca sexta]